MLIVYGTSDKLFHYTFSERAITFLYNSMQMTFEKMEFLVTKTVSQYP